MSQRVFESWPQSKIKTWQRSSVNGSKLSELDKTRGVQYSITQGQLDIALNDIGDFNMKHIFWITAVVITLFALSFNAIAQPGGGMGQRGQGQGGQGQGMGQGMVPGMGMGPGGQGMGQRGQGQGGQGMVPGMGMGPGGGGMVPGMGPGMGMGQLGAAFGNPELARIMEITPEQQRRLPGIIREALQEVMQNFTPGSGPAGQGVDTREMMRRFEQSADVVQTRIFAELTPAQQNRAREVTFQLTGGLDSPMLSIRALDVLDLSPTQRDQIRQIIETRNEANMNAMRDMVASGNIDFRTPEGRQQLQAQSAVRNQAFTQQITALLTPAQRDRLQELNAGAPALRERLGIAAPGQQGQGRGQQGQGGGRQGFVPGDGSWRPGQGGPAPAPVQPRGTFPRANQNVNQNAE